MTASLRERKKAQTKNRMAEAAVSILIDEGPEAATITAITEQAGVSVRTFHNYFTTREEAFTYYIRQFFNQIGEAIRAYPIKTSAVELMQDVLWQNLAETSGDMKTSYHVMSIAERLGLSVLSRDKNYPSSMFYDLGEILHQKMDGELSRYQAYLICHLTVSAAASAMEAYISGELTTDRDMRHLFDEAFDLLRRGIH